MLLSEIRDLPPGTALVTTRGDRVSFSAMTTVTHANGRTHRVAIVNLPSGHGTALPPRSLRLARKH